MFFSYVPCFSSSPFLLCFSLAEDSSHVFFLTRNTRNARNIYTRYRLCILRDGKHSAVMADGRERSKRPPRLPRFPREIKKKFCGRCLHASFVSRGRRSIVFFSHAEYAECAECVHTHYLCAPQSLPSLSVVRLQFQHIETRVSLW